MPRQAHSSDPVAVVVDDFSKMENIKKKISNKRKLEEEASDFKLKLSKPSLGKNSSGILITENDKMLPSGEHNVSYEDFSILRSKGSPGTQVMLANKWTEATNPSGWWMSEKLDGLRAFWNGTRFYSRLGNKFYAPDFFTTNFPKDIHLDGELFLGRGDFQKAVSIVKSRNEDKGWKTLTFQIFDAPNIDGKFEERIEAVADYFKKHSNTYVHVLEHMLCKGKDDLEKQLKHIESLNGEGLMIREKKSNYGFAERSKSLLKIKTFYDAEAVVIGYEPGKGRNTGVVGALCCKMESGITFKVGSGLNDNNRRKPPKKGSIITYKFQELSKSGKPRFPSYVGLRIDMDKPKDAVLPAGKSDG